MDTRTKEAVRYLGYGNCAVDDKTMQMIRDSFDELEQLADKKAIHRMFEVSLTSEDSLLVGTIEIQSKSLQKNLKDCEEVVLFGATLGTDVDRQMRKYELLDMSKAVVFQACAAAYLEEFCDEMQKEIAVQMKTKEKYLRPRFSPGYGDFSIFHQKDVLAMLDAPKRIGLTMTEGYMLTPTKSVTAVMGVSCKKEHCNIKGCEECEKKDCIYRRS